MNYLGNLVPAHYQKLPSIMHILFYGSTFYIQIQSTQLGENKDLFLVEVENESYVSIKMRRDHFDILSH